MALAGPNNVFDVKTIIVMLVALPNSNLEDNLMRSTLLGQWSRQNCPSIKVVPLPKCDLDLTFHQAEDS